MPRSLSLLIQVSQLQLADCSGKPAVYCRATDWGECIAVLRLSPGDVDALKCKAIANLQLGEYDEAAKVLSHKQLQQEMPFERVSSSRRLLQDVLAPLFAATGCDVREAVKCAA